ncbi:MAG: phosphoadenylyl-sulfate reductase [Planctomycetota bacterium]|jgi:phosphoadenosine phosphosulfate reductase
MKMNIAKIVEKWSVLHTEDLLRDIFQQFGIKAAVGTSFQKTGLVTIDIASKVADNFRVFTIDTGRLFPETYQYISQIEGLYSDKLHNNKIEIYGPDSSIVAAMVERHGEYLFFDNPAKRELCCNNRKVLPNNKALKTMNVWLTGLRADQSEYRDKLKNVQVISVAGKQIMKVAPLFHWTEADIDAYIEKRNLPIHPLYAEGYKTIGCIICTTPVHFGEDARAGRWRWEKQLKSVPKECGLHYQNGTGI